MTVDIHGFTTPTFAPLRDAFAACFPLGQHGGSVAVVHRGELHGVMLRSCRDNPLIDLRTDSEVAGYSQLEQGVEAILSEPELREQLVKLGIQPSSGTPEQLGAFIVSESQKWGDLVRQAQLPCGDV